MPEDSTSWLSFLAGLLVLSIIVALFFVLLWLLLRTLIVPQLAEEQVLFTFRKEGHIQYLMEGDRLIAYVYLIHDKWIDQNTGDVLLVGWKKVADEHGKETLVQDADAGKEVNDPTWSERIFGAYWIGLPPRQIKKYKIMYFRPLRPGDEAEAAKHPTQYKVDVKHELVGRFTETTYHAYRQIYSLHIDNVEVMGFAFVDANDQSKSVQGQAQVSFWGTFTLLTKNARIPVLELDGQWFAHVEDEIKGTISDIVREMTLDEIRRARKTTGENNDTTVSDFERDILAASKGTTGTGATTGLEIVAYNNAGFEVEDEAEKAMRKRGLAQVEAETRGIEGKAEGNFEENRLKGVAKGYSAVVGALNESSIAAGVLIAQERRAGMASLTFPGTYVEGGNGSGMGPLVTIPATNNTGARTTKNQSPEGAPANQNDGDHPKETANEDNPNLEIPTIEREGGNKAGRRHQPGRPKNKK